MTVFESGVDGAKYDGARPYFHPFLFARLRERFAGWSPDRALDIGCGTGQSTEALGRMWVPQVVGIDVSEVMLRHARRGESIYYVRGRAEELPFASGTFPLVAVGLAFHWLGREAFLAEAARVLVSRGLLLLYDSGLPRRMSDSPAWPEWLVRFRDRFPGPPRGSELPTPEEVHSSAFEHIMTERHTYSEAYGYEELAEYLETQSNILFAVQERRARPDSIRRWLDDTLKPMFDGGPAMFEYEPWLALYRRVF